MTRIKQLAQAIQGIYLANKQAIDSLSTTGPNGGTNARYIDGWRNYGVGAITQAANLSDMPVLNYWSGSGPTPSSAMPECVYAAIMDAYNRIFGL